MINHLMEATLSPVKNPLLLLSSIFSLMTSGTAPAEDATVLKEDFSTGASRWVPTDAKAWRVTELEGNPVYELFQQSRYEPPHRSPFNYSLLKDTPLSDFELTAKVRTTKAAYGHRDMCLIFGHQDAAHFYYVHFGEKADDHANQIFIVNHAPRVKISEASNPGTPWRENHWHTVKLVRRVSSGLIQVFFDDLNHPAMEAHDKTFATGLIGLGSFDDVGMWDDVEIRRLPASRP